MTRVIASAAALLAISLVALGCGGSSSSDSKEITVWDYYGSATPIKPAVAAYEKLHPDVKIHYEAIDYDTIRDKFSVAVSSGDAPDVATLDMTWIPTYAAKGLLGDLSSVSGGELNGQPIENQYSPGALGAMNYQDHLVTMLYDFDAYALFYRADLFKQDGVEPPRTWSEFQDAAKQVAEVGSDGKLQRYGFQVLPDTFHYDQFLLQNKGSLLSSDDSQATFQEPAGVQALDFYKSFLDDGTGIYWGDEQGDSTGVPGIKDGRIAMFLNGPYMMGVLKDSVPEQSGKWAVAPAPVGKQQGSYLGGTGLVIPTNAPNESSAWDFVQFLLSKNQQLGVYKDAGAAPATLAALSSAELNKPDKYFGGERPFPIFRDALSTATPFPYVESWDEIDKSVTDAVTVALLGDKSSQAALDEGATRVDKALGK